MTSPDPLKDLEQLVEEFRRSGLRELHARCGDLEVYLSHDADAGGLDAPRVSVSQGAPAALAASAATPVSTSAPAIATPAADADCPEGAVLVLAPYLGTFYRAPKPGAPVYVEADSEVTAETELCLVEVMKLFTAVRAGVSGRVVRILAGDGELVQAGQPLFAVMPAS